MSWYSIVGLIVLCALSVGLFVCSLVVLDAKDAARQKRELFDE